MMIWILRLFPAFTALEARLVQANALAEMHSRRADVAEQSAESVQAHIEDLKRMVDSLSFRADRRYVFNRNEAPPMPESTPEPVRGRRFARDEVNRRNAQFFASQRREMPTAEQEIESLRAEAAELVSNG